MLDVVELPKVFVRLKPGRDRTVRNRHPWIFSGAVAEVEGDAELTSPAIAEVRSAEGEWLARGLYHPRASLCVRLYTWNPDQPLGADLWRKRVLAAVQRRADYRAQLRSEGTTAVRMLYSETDGLSGLVADLYEDVLSVRVSCAGLVPDLPAILEAACEATAARAVVVRADPDAVEREQIPSDVLEGLSNGPNLVEFSENGLRFEAELVTGQKTGFFLDQRENRRRVAAWACGRRVLSAYCCTGAFEVLAARHGAAELVGLDTSETALERARRHHQLNGTSVPVDYRAADVSTALRRFRDEGRTFDLIILDPPRFVFTHAQKEKGLRAYKDINLFAMKLLTPGGILATFSCSGMVSRDEFAATLRWAARDAGCDVRILEQLTQPPDHPVLVTCPETEYLKGFLCSVERE